MRIRKLDLYSIIDIGFFPLFSSCFLRMQSEIKCILRMHKKCVCASELGTPNSPFMFLGDLLQFLFPSDLQRYEWTWVIRLGLWVRHKYWFTIWCWQSFYPLRFPTSLLNSLFGLQCVLCVLHFPAASVLQ